jgi:hypothetical protein
MKTIFAAVVLVVLGIVANFLSIWVLNVAGLPGALIAVAPSKASKGRAILAIVLTILGQSYVYLAYTAFIVNWTSTASARSDVPMGFLLWIPALLVVIFPIWWMMGSSSERAKARGFVSVQDEAVGITFLIVILGFILFAFIPSLIKLGWGWVPYVR